MGRKVYWLCAHEEGHNQNIKVKGMFCKMTEDAFFAKLDELAEGKIVGHDHGEAALSEYSKRRALVINMRPLLDIWPVAEGEVSDILVISNQPPMGQNPTVPNEFFKRADGALLVYATGTSKFQGDDDRMFFKWIRRFPCMHRSNRLSA